MVDVETRGNIDVVANLGDPGLAGLDSPMEDRELLFVELILVRVSLSLGGESFPSAFTLEPFDFNYWDPPVEIS